MLSKLKVAIDCIDSFYYQIENPLLRDGTPIGYSKKNVLLEQRFMYELYHQLKLQGGFGNFQVDAEIQKRVSKKSRIIKEIKKAGIKRVKPDLLIHQGQSFNEKRSQSLVLECKVGLLSQERFNKDLLKLMIYREDLKFKNCIFLIVNVSEKRVEKLLLNYKNSENYISNNSRGINILLKSDYSSKIKTLRIEKSSSYSIQKH